MIRALEAGIKTQTRRIVKGDHSLIDWNPVQVGKHFGLTDEHGYPVRCPYGTSGTHLYVKETFLIDGPDRDAPGAVHYQSQATPADLEWLKSRGLRWVPGRFMPRALARIYLELTGVNVERVQGISEDHARAEGCPLENNADPRAWYQGIFESLNGKDAWEKNPWVFVLSFRIINLKGVGDIV